MLRWLFILCCFLSLFVSGLPVVVVWFVVFFDFRFLAFEFSCLFHELSVVWCSGLLVFSRFAGFGFLSFLVACSGVCCFALFGCWFWLLDCCFCWISVVGFGPSFRFLFVVMGAFGFCFLFFLKVVVQVCQLLLFGFLFFQDFRLLAFVFVLVFLSEFARLLVVWFLVLSRFAGCWVVGLFWVYLFQVVVLQLFWCLVVFPVSGLLVFGFWCFFCCCFMFVDCVLLLLLFLSRRFVGFCFLFLIVLFRFAGFGFLSFLVFVQVVVLRCFCFSLFFLFRFLVVGVCFCFLFFLVVVFVLLLFLFFQDGCCFVFVLVFLSDFLVVGFCVVVWVYLFQVCKTLLFVLLFVRLFGFSGFNCSGLSVAVFSFFLFCAGLSLFRFTVFVVFWCLRFVF